jgi:hypothetical protein
MSNYDSIFNAALEAYKRQTKNDLTSHPLLSRLQSSCHSPRAILAALREQIIPIPSESLAAQSQSGDGDGDGDDRFSRWLVPTVNVLYAFSATLAEGAGIVNTAVCFFWFWLDLSTILMWGVCLFFRSQAFSPAKIIFAGIGVLLSAVSIYLSILFSSPSFFAPIIVTQLFIYFFQAASDDVGAGRAMLVEHFSRVEYFFNRLETYTTVPPTAAMTNIIVEIMVAMLSFLALATKELKRGRMGKSAAEKILAAAAHLGFCWFSKMCQEADAKRGR